jgi:hypothetical protein
MVTLIVTTVGGLLAQLIAIAKSNAETKKAAHLLVIESEQRRLDADMLRRASDKNKETVRVQAQHQVRAMSHLAQKQDVLKEEIKGVIQENTALTQDGARAAEKAYEVANEVNQWRAEMNKQIEALNASLKDVLETRASNQEDVERKVDNLLENWERFKQQSKA